MLCPTSGWLLKMRLVIRTLLGIVEDTTKKIIAISGSLRKESDTTKLLRAFAQHTPKGYELEIVYISELPIFNQD